NAATRSSHDTGHQGYGSRCSRRAVANCGDLTASSQRDDFERWSAQHAAALECAEGAVAVGHAAAVGCSGLASVAVGHAAAVGCSGLASVAVGRVAAVGCSGPASVAAGHAAAVGCSGPASVAVGHAAAVGCSGPASVAVELASAAYLGSAVAGHAVAACPGSVAADRAVVQA